MAPLSNLQTRAVETLHPSLYQSGDLSRNRPAGDRARQGRLHLRHRRQGLSRRHGRAVVHGARLRQRGAGRGRGGADAQAPVRAPVHRQEPRSGDRACREAERDRAGADLEGVLLQFRLGSQRQPDEARLVHEQRARPAEEEEDHQPREGLSRRHDRLGLAHRPAEQPHRFRPADRARAAHRRARITIASARTARARRSSRRAGRRTGRADPEGRARTRSRPSSPSR